MSLRNTLKILSSNFSLTWKSGLYKFVCFSLIMILCYQLFSPIFTLLQSENIGGEILAFFEGLFSFRGNEMATASTNIADIVSTIIDGQYWLTIASVFALLFIALPFLFSLSTTAESGVLHGAMSYNTKIKYTASFMSNLKNAIKLSAFNLLFTIPYSLIVCFVLYSCLKLLVVGGFVTYLGIFLFILLFLLAITFARTLMGYLQPALFIHDTSIREIFKRGAIINFRQFGKNFSNNFILVVCLFFVNAFIGLYTFGVGLLLTLPASLLSFNILSLVIYYNSYGINYYTSPSEIIYSKKLIEQIDIKVMKYIM